VVAPDPRIWRSSFVVGIVGNLRYYRIYYYMFFVDPKRRRRRRCYYYYYYYCRVRYWFGWTTCFVLQAEACIYIYVYVIIRSYYIPIYIIYSARVPTTLYWR